MNESAKKIGDKFLKGNKLFQLIRYSITGQISGYTDMGVGVLLVALGMSAWWATAIGGVCGAIVNCTINYKFTFRVESGNVRNVIIKYFMVWVGSMTLNTVGTAELAELLKNLHFMDRIGFTNVADYAVARVTVSLLVSLGWNYILQKFFVYRENRFDALVNRTFDEVKNR